jgi:hypothetical protein
MGKTVPEEPTELPLHCPHCWYNLTGSVDRCPECGEQIDAQAIKALGADLRDAVTPIDPWRIAMRLLIAPGIAWCALLFGGLLMLMAGRLSEPGVAAVLAIVGGWGVAIVALAVAGFTALGFAFATGGQIAARLSCRAAKPLTSAYYGAVLATASFTFLAIQAALALCVPALVLLMAGSLF